jgi:hypothetical protein
VGGFGLRPEPAPLEGPLISPRTTQKPKRTRDPRAGRLGDAPLRRCSTLAQGNCHAMKKTPFPQAQMLDSQGVLHEWHWPVHNPAPWTEDTHDRGPVNSVDKALKCLGDSRHGMPADKPTNCAIEPLYRFEATTWPRPAIRVEVQRHVLRIHERQPQLTRLSSLAAVWGCIPPDPVFSWAAGAERLFPPVKPLGALFHPSRRPRRYPFRRRLSLESAPLRRRPVSDLDLNIRSLPTRSLRPAG